jgi:hypothetical protein
MTQQMRRRIVTVADPLDTVSIELEGHEQIPQGAGHLQGILGDDPDLSDSSTASGRWRPMTIRMPSK